MSDTSELALLLHDATPPWLFSYLREWTSGAEDKGHAYLVVSEDAEEASVFARQLAMQQLCHDLQDGMACTQCQSCQAFLQGTHGDLLLLQMLEVTLTHAFEKRLPFLFKAVQRAANLGSGQSNLRRHIQQNDGIRAPITLNQRLKLAY